MVRASGEALSSRLPSVREVLYLLFNEGYLSAHAEQAIVELYSLLERSAPSPLHTLNKAVAIAEWKRALSSAPTPAVHDLLARRLVLSGSRQ